MKLKIECPGCGKIYNVSEKKIPSQGANVKCKCGQRFFCQSHSEKNNTTVFELDGTNTDRTKNNSALQSTPGYVYALLNPSFEGLIKIGKTTREIQVRIKELSSTGVPTPFVLAHYIFVNDCNQAENMIHSLLKERNYRFADDKEFFNAPLKVVIDLLETIKDKIGYPDVIPSITNDSTNDYTEDVLQEYIDQFEKKAYEYLWGENGKIIDEKKALTLYEKAAKLGSAFSYLQMAQIYAPINEESSTIKKDINRQIQCLLKCSELNHDEWGSEACETLSFLYKEMKDPIKCKNAWEKCLRHTIKFNNSKILKKKSEKNPYLRKFAHYIVDMFVFNQSIDRSLIFGHYDEFYNDLIIFLHGKYELDNDLSIPFDDPTMSLKAINYIEKEFQQEIEDRS